MNRSATLVDAPARARIRNDLDATLFVEAAAGTGKTTELIARIVGLLCAGKTTLDRIVAVTFTEKAAGEMKLRLRAEIEQVRERGDVAVHRRLDAALEQLELARIGTIHGFCADVLRGRPIEAGVDPLFQVADEDEAGRLLDRAFDSWFERVLADPPAGIRRMLRRRPRGRDRQTPREALRAAAGSLVEHRDFPTAWRRDPFDRAAAIDAALAELDGIAALASKASWANDFLAQNLTDIHRFVSENALHEAVRGRDYDALESELRDLLRWRSWRWRGSPNRPYGPGLPRQDVIARRDRVRGVLENLTARLDADLAPLLREELRPVVGAYETLKQRCGRLDFTDLLMRTRDMIVSNGTVRNELRKDCTHYFVDEFQDTDPLQVEILLLLASEDPNQADWRHVTPTPGKLFLVGDPKQSIYRFRRADIAIYEGVKRQLEDHGADVIQLRTSFRGLPSLQAAVNSAFAPLMQVRSDGSQAGYVALEAHRSDVATQPAIVALPVPRPYKDYDNWAQIQKQQIEESLPDAVGAFVEWLVQRSGWTVTERERPEERVAVQPRHVCLLFRRLKRFRDDVTRGYVRALEVRQIAHVLVGGRSFHDREEVLAIRNALCAIEWPDDELRVFATLRGPLFALGDDVLLAYRTRYGSLHPLRRHEASVFEAPEGEVAGALAILARLHVGRNRRPIAATIERLLAAVRAHAGIAIWPTGEQALANCLRMVDLARRFERSGAVSFRAFVERMEDEAESGVAEEAPSVEEGTEGVRIMSVHRAKGLEFPVVILADPTCSAVREPPSRHMDPARKLWLEPLCGCAPVELVEAYEEETRRDRDEAVRLVYVAATRARDLLVVPVIGDGTGADAGDWLDAFNPAVYPASQDRRRAALAPGCPAFGSDSVLVRPLAVRERAADAIAPGMHQPQVGTHRVVWWDPRALDLDKEQTVGLRQERILQADEGRRVSDAGEQAHRRWQELRRERIGKGVVETMRAQAVTQRVRAATDPTPSADIELIQVARDVSGRPAGARFGALVHAILATVPLTASAAEVADVGSLQGRILGATPGEVSAAIPAVTAVLAHPLMDRARAAAAAGECRRETPVMLRTDDGELVEGVVDLAFLEDQCWTVVDFKTDRELEKALDVYRRQVDLYAGAIRAATGLPARPVLLRV